MDGVQLHYSARDAGRNRQQLFQKEKHTNFESVDRKRRLMRSGISAMAQPNPTGVSLTPRATPRPLSPQQVAPKQTDMGRSTDADDILKAVVATQRSRCVEPIGGRIESPSDHDVGAVASPRGDARAARTLPTNLFVNGREAKTTGAYAHDDKCGNERHTPHGKSCPSTEAGNVQSARADNRPHDAPDYRSLRGRLLVATGPGCVATEENEICSPTRPQKQKKRWQGNMAAKESHLNQIFSNYSSRSDCLEDALQVRGLLKEVFATFDADVDEKSKVASVVGQLPLPITRYQLVSIVCVSLWSAKRPQSGSTSAPWRRAQQAFIETQMEKVGMLDGKPMGGSGGTSRATSRGGSRANSRSGSQYGSRIGSRIASRTGSSAVSQSGTPRARSMSFRRAGSRGRDISSGSAQGDACDEEGQHMRNLKMLPAENILMKGKTHRPISPNKSPKSANKGHVASSDVAPCPFPTKARTAMDVDDVLFMVSKRLLSDSSPETA
eukprot:GEMP01015763.1.p1 GENE.GEMP01015763.1~~GEMP01015763.1.p1  ORF type:complete len:496 (+),score=104.45 GEMP01015763.1:62-1549(+)